MHIDLHNHLIPGVDDGAASVEEALAAIDRLADDGVEAAVATPHVDGSITTDPARLEARMAEIDAAFKKLVEAAKEHRPGFALHRAAEVMLDVPSPDLSDERIRIAGSRYVLVEFPFMRIPPNSVNAVFDIRMRGQVPIIAHPERYSGIARNLGLIEEWCGSGALLQVNTGSLVGRYGDQARRTAWTLLERGWAHLLSSDYHARGRTSVAEARHALLKRGGESQITILFEVNPKRIIEDADVEEPAPFPEPKSAWKRLFGTRT